MTTNTLSKIELLVLDLLMRARQRGIERLNRLELLNSPALPEGVRLQLVFAALAMPKAFVTWHGSHDFSITDAGIAAYRLHAGGAEPTAIADSVICLPGPTETMN